MAERAIYRIRVGGQIGQDWQDWFDGMRIVNHPDGEATLEGPVADQAALHGLLARLRDLNLELLEVRKSRTSP